MPPSGRDDTLDSMVLLVLEGMGPMWIDRLRSCPGTRLGRLLGSGSSCSVKIPTGPGRNAVATTLATGDTPSKHVVIGRREPDRISMEVRNIDARSWRLEPFWSEVVRSRRTTAVVGWPVLDPVTEWTVPGDDPSTGQTLVGTDALTSRQDPADAWLLPPMSVHPEATRPLVRSNRVHVDEREDLTPLRAFGESIVNVSRALLLETEPDLLVSWIPFPEEFDRERDPAEVDFLDPLLESIGDRPLALLALPRLPAQPNMLLARPPARLFLHGCSLGPDEGSSMWDVDLAGLVCRLLGLDFKPTSRPVVDPDLFLERARQRAARFLASGFNPFRTQARRRVYASSMSYRDVIIGLDQFERGDLGAARDFLTEVVQSTASEIGIVYLARALIASGKQDHVERLVESLPTGSDLRRSVAAAHAVMKDEPTIVSELLTQPPTSSVCLGFMLESLLRIGATDRACAMLRGSERGQLLGLSYRDRRIGMICARRSGKGPLCAVLARLVLMMRPDRARLRRFLRPG